MSVAFSPLIAKRSGLLVPESGKVSSLKQMIMDLSAENAVYKKNQKKLFRSHDEVMDANKSLQSGIAESQKVLDWVWLVRAVLGEYMLVGYVGRWVIYLISVLFVNICFPNRPKCPFCG